MSLKLVHFCNSNSTNIGNGALIHATESMIEHDFKRPVEWVRLPWDDYTFEKKKFDSALVELFNQCDGVIVNGAVAFNGRQYLKNSGFRFDLPFELWSSIKVPLIFYGLSYRHWPGETYHHVDKLEKVLDYIERQENIVLAVRNDGTRPWLDRTIGRSYDGIVDVPDPGMFVPKQRAGTSPYINPTKKNIVISFNNEDNAFRYKNSDSISAKQSMASQPVDEIDNFLLSMRNVLMRLFEQYDLNVILASHHSDDIEMSHKFINLFPAIIAHQKFVVTGTCGIHSTDAFYDVYKSADLAYSMRIHSMSPCIGLGVPMIPIVTQKRMTEFLENAQLSDAMVNPFQDNFEAELFEKSISILENKSNALSQFSTLREKYRGQFAEFNKTIETLFVE